MKFIKRFTENFNSEFWGWFGNSKVVDRQGNPLIVYHGSPSDFDNFTPKKMGHGEFAPHSSFYFTTKKENARGFADNEVYNTVGKIYEVYLSIQKPKIVDSIEDMRKAEKSAGRRGYDGIIAKGVKDGNIISDIYIAFHPTQIKSVNNKGTWDRRNPNIYEKETKPLSQRISGDHLLDIEDMIEELEEVSADIDQFGNVTVYHATNLQSAEEIAKGIMLGKERELFFSTKSDGEIQGYGDTIVKMEIPSELFSIDDIFSDEIHLTLDTKGKRYNVKNFNPIIKKG